MSSQEEFLFWRLAHYFISKQEYRIIQLSKSQKELWLEKMEDKETQVIRILLHHLDWSNWMQRDIEITAANGESIRKQLSKRYINILNIYVTPYPPVDDYQFRIDQPFLHPNGGKTKITSIICDRQNGRKNMGAVSNDSIFLVWKDEYSEDEVEAEKQNALSAARNKAKSEKSLFEHGKPLFTYLFMAIQIIVFLLMEVAGGSTTTSVLIKFGAKVNWLILDGEWWRLFTPIVLHIGFLHLLMNTMALYYLGTMVERIYGNIRFLYIYLFAGFIGSLASFVFSPNISAGASGAIFGCFGALLYFGTVYPKLFFRTMGLNILIVLGINLAFGFTVAGIDNAGHIGGLIGGFLATAVVHFPKKKRLFFQLSSLIVSAVLVYGTFQYSFTHPQRLLNEQSALALAQDYIKQENFAKASDMLNQFSGQNGKSAEILFLLSFIEIKTGKLEQAKAHLHQVIDMKTNFHEAYYNLALVYLDEKNYQEAKALAAKAADIQPSNADYQKLIKHINHLESAALGS